MAEPGEVQQVEGGEVPVNREYLLPAHAAQLKPTELATGEENETVVWERRAKLYRFSNGEWKERGTGQASILKQNDRESYRFLLRQEGTLKLRANHHLAEGLCLHRKADTKRAYTWKTPLDSADDEPHPENFCIRFLDIDAVRSFIEMFVKATKSEPPVIDEEAAPAAAADPSKAPEEKKDEEKKDEKKDEKEEEKKD